MNMKKFGAGALALALCAVSAGADFPQNTFVLHAQEVKEVKTEEKTALPAEEILASLNESDITESGEYDSKFKYTIFSETIMVVSGSGAMDEHQEFETITDKSKIKTLIITSEGEEAVTSIGAYAFESYTELESVYIPDTVEYIGASAFSRCSSLSEISLPSSLKTIDEHAFLCCSSINSIVFPEDLSVISKGVFEGCSGLTEIIIPDSVTYIGPFAFSGCSSVKKISLGNNINNIAEDDTPNSISTNAFYGDTSVTDISMKALNASENWGDKSIVHSLFDHNNSLAEPLNIRSVEITEGESIHSYTFSDLSSLEKVSLPDETSYIGGYAFAGCSDLAELSLPASLKTIDEGAFFRCSSLNSVVFPENLSSISNRAFEDCSGLTEIIIPDSVLYVGQYAFSGCSAVKKISLGNNINNIAEEDTPYSVSPNAFYGDTSVTDISMKALKAPESWGDKGIIHSLFDHNNSLAVPLNIKSVEITEGEFIHSYTFSGLSSLEKVSLPDETSYIDGYAFAGCSDLSEISLPASLKTIDEGAFFGCSSLTSVIFPEKLEIIFDKAFENCSGLTEIIIPDSVSHIGGYAFSNCTGVKSILIGHSISQISEDPDAFENVINANAFYGDTSVTSISMPSLKAPDNWNDKGIIYALFDYFNAMTAAPGIKTAEITEGENIASYTFSGLSSLEKVYLPDETSYIGGYAFAGCSDLAEISLPASLKTIDKGAFNGCASLNTVVFPEKLETISDYAFENCSGLTEIIIPDSVSHIGGYAFSNCTGVKSICIGHSISQISEDPDAFENVINANAFYGDTSVTSISMPSLKAPDNWNDKGIIYSLFDYYYTMTSAPGIKTAEITEGGSISAYTFSGLSSLEKVYLPDETSYIGGYAFAGCSELAELSLPVSLKTIDERAFFNCGSLNTIGIHDDLETVSDYAFELCKGLKTVNYFGTKEQWEKVKYDPEKNEDLANAEIFFAGQSDPNEEILIGDVDGSGIVDLSDLTLLSMYLLKDRDLDKKALLCADTKPDGEVDIADLATLKQMIMHAI